MTYRPRRRCRSCGRDRDECGGVSRTGLCRDCGPRIEADALRQIAAHQGEHYDAWLEGITSGIARLWGVRVTAEEIAAEAVEELLSEVEA